MHKKKSTTGASSNKGIVSDNIDMTTAYIKESFCTSRNQDLCSESLELHIKTKALLVFVDGW
jgi:hypothetical protein